VLCGLKMTTIRSNETMAANTPAYRTANRGVTTVAR
jgi:hypothetical protein